ncbi:HK97 gp10 family phage protein [Streptomyces sp. TRM66268-LWL]|uniref:HK97 gp10 family phage protein n=1 Tax=Streptomyces polyasparticus TaxID=2767826 RepID=A0ABR7SJJ0_9ACTN|nr:HK97 gp10 family phage protein [Streptomyces polyasparticus]MBC9714503.1 HK97 gp10 family phage protein [Streptomyces polyasparticus]
MARTSAFTVRVQGMRGLQQNVRRLKSRELNNSMRAANKKAAEVVKPEAESTAPKGARDAKSSKRYKPGKLAKSVKVTASVKGAQVKAGSAARVPYAAPVHFGYPKRGIKPNRFLFRAMARKSAEVSETYEREISAVVRQHLEGD